MSTAEDMLIVRENKSLFNGNIDNLVVTNYDDHNKHINAHYDFLRNNHVTPEQRERFISHIEAHKIMVIQSNQPDPNIIPGKDLVFNTSGAIQPRKEYIFESVPYDASWKSNHISCCSDHKNQAIYTNFYDKKIKYCQKCGNEIK